MACKPRKKSCAFLKKYCERLSKNEIDFCFKCEKFPCVHLQKLDKGYQEKYGISVIENLLFIKQQGIDMFLKQQEKRYTCPDCGKNICVHTKMCYHCNKVRE